MHNTGAFTEFPLYSYDREDDSDFDSALDEIINSGLIKDIWMLMSHLGDKTVPFLDSNDNPELVKLLNVRSTASSISIRYTADFSEKLGKICVRYSRKHIPNVREFFRAIGQFYQQPLTKKQVAKLGYDSKQPLMAYNALINLNGSLTKVIDIHSLEDGSYWIELGM